MGEDYAAKVRRSREELLCGVQEHEDLLRDRDATLSVLTDFVQEHGLTDFVDLMGKVQNCIEPLSQLLKMVVRYDWDEDGGGEQEMPASLYRNGEMYRRVMELSELLKNPRFAALAKADPKRLL